jgi:20S proteasome alpha/beta subunit
VLASVDLYGTLIKKDYIVTGFAKHFGLALIANEWNPNLSADECRNLIKRAFEVIYMRDCHSIDQIQFAVVTKDNI